MANKMNVRKIIPYHAKFFAYEWTRQLPSNHWASAMKISLEKEIKDLDAEITLRKSEAKKMLQLDAKVKAQRVIKDLEKKRSEKRQISMKLKI